jgi:hypothetical protein
MALLYHIRGSFWHNNMSHYIAYNPYVRYNICSRLFHLSACLLNWCTSNLIHKYFVLQYDPGVDLLLLINYISGPAGTQLHTHIFRQFIPSSFRIMSYTNSNRSYCPGKKKYLLCSGHLCIIHLC